MKLFKGTMIVTINACDLFGSLSDSRFPKLSCMSISQSVEIPATVNDRFVVGGSLMAQNGVGSGDLSLIWRRLLGPSLWAEVGV